MITQVKTYDKLLKKRLTQKVYSILIKEMMGMREVLKYIYELIDFLRSQSIELS